MDDLISRRAAIKAVESAMQNYTSSSIAIYAARDNIILLPPARPNLDEWCTDCKEYDSEKHCCPRFNRVIRQTLSEQPEIIRCKDCKHRDAKIGFCEGRGWPMQLVPDDGFCDKGERSEE